jgi:predicted dehydrogenase
MSKIRIAQIGVVQPHASGYRESLLQMPEVEIVGAYDPDLKASRADMDAHALHWPLYDDVPALLATEHPDVVLICMPPVETSAIIQQAAVAGCHIYAEKPCARTAEEFLPAVKEIETAGVQFATGYMRHFSPAALTLKSYIERGFLGRMVSAEGGFITTSVSSRNANHWIFNREQSGGGIFHWLGCHWLDLFRWITSSEVESVAAILGTCSGEEIDVEDTGTLALRYSNGMIGSIHCSYITDPASGIDSNQWYVGLRGTLGWVKWGPDESVLQVRSVHPDWQTAPTRTIHFKDDPVPGYGGATGIVALRQFFASFRDNAPAPFTAYDALRILETLDAAGRSSNTGRHVKPEYYGGNRIEA